MKSLLLSLVILCSGLTSLAQETFAHDYPDGIYYTLDDFFNHSPDTSIAFRKLNLEVPSSMAFADTLTDHVWFLDKNNDILKKLFAIVHQGEVYFQEKAMRKLMVAGFGHEAIGATNVFHRIKVRGRYFYGEASYVEANYDVAMATMMFGLVGGLVTAALTDPGGGLKSGSKLLAPFVFDTKSKAFYVFVSKPRLRSFMKQYYPDYPLDLEDAKLTVDTVKNLFLELNDKEQMN